MKIWKKRISAILAAALLVTAISPNIRVQAGTSANAESGSNAIEAETEYYSETPSNATKIVVETPSNAINLGIANYTQPGPLLPATGGIMMFRMMRAMLLAESEEPEGIHTSKSATYNEEDDSYRIRLESFVEGEINTKTETTPVDIVLVLDLSGSMDYCIRCGGTVIKDICPSSYHKLDHDPIPTETYYYYYESFYGSGYMEAYYCDGTGTKCNHEAGWYTAQDSRYHTNWYRLSTDDLFEYEQVACTSRIDALQDAVCQFIEDVADNAAENGVNHNIAIVKFAGEKSSQIGNSTHIENYGANGKATANYSQVVVGMTDMLDLETNSLDQVNVNLLKNQVGKLKPAGQTRSDFGMELAEELLNGITRNSKKIVVMFTDGEPSTYSSFDDTVAKNAIETSYSIKAAGATVYTIGVFAGADPKADFDGSDDEEKTNRYMHYVSSNFKEALSLDDGGKATYPTSGSYYLSAGDEDSLNAIFQGISDEITSGGSKVELDSETTIYDVVTPYFTMPNNVSDIYVYTDECTGKSEGIFTFEGNKTLADDVTVGIDTKTNTISVTGFDYSYNFVAENGREEGNTAQSGDFYGRKLIIEFTVTPKEGFLGGNGVPTNVYTSRIESADGATTKHFEVPTVNVPIQPVTVTAAEKNVYLTGELSASDLKGGSTVKCGDIPIDLTKDDYGLDDWQSEYVNINISTSGPTDKTALKSDTTYTIDVKISPTSIVEETVYPKAEAREGSGSANINVFKPTITFKDGEAYYGDELPDETYFNSLRVGDPEWKHAAEDGTTTISTAVTMIGDAPDITTSAFTPDAANVETKVIEGISKTFINTKEDVPVKVDSIKIGETDIKEHTTLERNKCMGDADVDGDFALHIKTCSLDVQKVGGSPEETYIMNVKRNGDAYTTVIVAGSETVSLKELPVGTYTIEEDTNWSWRYTAEFDKKAVLLNKDNSTDKITCTNTKNNDHWLSFASTVKNTFTKGKDGEISE